MQRVYTNEACLLHGSAYCAMLNMESCASCTVCSDSREKADAIRADLDVILSNMPDQSMHALFAGDGCLLCKGEPLKKKWYALTDIAHVQPRRKKATVLGIARDSRVGTVLPVQIACCEACRKRFLALEYVRPLTGTIVAALALIVLSIRRFREPIAALAEILPFAIFITVTALGIIAGKIIRDRLRKKYGAHTHLSIMELPVLRDMAERGWFELTPADGMSRLVFSKTPIKQGLFTGWPTEDAVQSQHENGEHAEENSETV